MVPPGAESKRAGLSDPTTLEAPLARRQFDLFGALRVEDIELPELDRIRYGPQVTPSIMITKCSSILTSRCHRATSSCGKVSTSFVF